MFSCRRCALPLTAIAFLTIVALRTGRAGDLADRIVEDLDHPAIGYREIAPDDPVARLGQRLRDGSATLTFDGPSGYLRALLRELDIPVESQVVVFSKTSLQRQNISPRQPRAVYFNDSVTLAWPTGGFVEIAAHDPRQGVMFYTAPHVEMAVPVLSRSMQCLTCHYSFATLGVPGLLARSVVTAADGETRPALGNYLTDDRSPLDERWAGWFVTGHSASARHLGNTTVPSTRIDGDMAPAASSTRSLERALAGHATPHSDIAALLVFNHQTRLINLITRVGWEARMAMAKGDAPAVIDEAAHELADALLFVDEAPLPAGIAGSSGFTDVFGKRGPADRRGRSLRDLVLGPRLMRYPCSYLIYSEAFDALPKPALDATYRRLWEILSGGERTARYDRLTRADRTAIVEILRDTKNGLPAYFTQPVS